MLRYERGEAFGSQLAKTFGVHRNTVYALLKRRGAVRGSRVDEVMAPIIAEFDERRQHALRARHVQDRLWIEQANEMMRPIQEFMRALQRADREGTLGHFDCDLWAEGGSGPALIPDETGSDPLP